ncbi:lysophospholipid acyltransferase family protein [Geothrix sp. PMB-07]|uniref:lysophospholipid acyltransferase family protein n=1 Tax=Geothrix sp. PMB-07 TaxID=3068640 RepID=UPI002741037D|nr:lysophospholipid acyltransferase family protein [Geothrix sp. PMB-07]WLT33387.1 lysophospholipid acyltransferase family protein [Geothrix sp. PMB-07]
MFRSLEEPAVPPLFEGLRSRSLRDSAAGRLLRVLAGILRYDRQGARCEARHGGRIPRDVLQGLLTDWAWEAQVQLNLDVRRTGARLPLQSPALFVGNHLSYLDIPVLMSQVPLVFLGKEEISRWPFFGAAGRRAGMVFVRRESDGSRRQAVKAISECLETRGMSLGLFPSGTTSLDEARPWRVGAFRIAKEGRFPIQPFRLTYQPLREAAFLGADALLPHLYRLLKMGPVRAQIEFGEARLVDDPEATARELQAWCREGLRR